MPFDLRADPRGPLRIYEMPEPGVEYVCGADTGGGMAANDWSAATVIRVDTLSTAATFRAHLEADDFGDVVWSLSSFYGADGDPCFTVPEVNNHGLACVNRIRDLGHNRIAMRSVWDSTKSRMQAMLGFRTDQRTRPMLIAGARRALNEPSIRIRCQTILTEATTFVINEDGREDHLDGCNDDALMSWMLALYGAGQWRRKREEEKREERPRSPDAWVWDRVRELREQAPGNEIEDPDGFDATEVGGDE